MGELFAQTAAESRLAPLHPCLHHSLGCLLRNGLCLLQVRVALPSHLSHCYIYMQTPHIWLGSRPISPTAHVSSRYVVYDNDGHVKPLKGSCFNLADMQENICVFAAGQGAYGLIAVGQAAVGLVVLAQGGVGAYHQIVAVLLSHFHTSLFSALLSLQASSSLSARALFL